MRWLIAIVCLWCVALPVAAQDAMPGRLDRYPGFVSQNVAPRDIQVWTPEGYDPGSPLPVIYMHDGQMLWDAKATWNKQAWNVAQTMTRLIKAGRIPAAIVVGIDNGGPLRGREYLPAKVFEGLPQGEQNEINAAQGMPLSDAYLKFLVNEVKPFVDAHYATLPDRAHTFVMGSSMGGLISFYAQSEYPQVFGASASLSMHWLLATSKIRKVMPDPDIYAPKVADAFARYLDMAKLNPQTARIYVDQGSETLDAAYRPYSLRFETLMKARGWSDPAHFSAQIFPGEDHSEASWARRLEVPLEFLLTGKVVKSGTLIHMPQVSSQHVAPRDVRVWLPDGYSSDTRYKVIYMMDGQNVFEPSPWSHADWGITDTLPGLIASGAVPPAIVVAIDNVEGRTAEYDPQGVYDILPEDYQARARSFAGDRTPNADAFLRFLVSELKPKIDSIYSTIRGPEGTAIMGASSGGLIALYAQGQYPKVFGASASLSMPWIMAMPPEDDLGAKADVTVLATAYQMWLSGSGMKPGQNRIYTDQGTVGLDARFSPYREAMVAMLRREGWQTPNLADPVYEAAEHSEAWWRKRMAIPLQFLLGAQATAPVTEP